MTIVQPTVNPTGAPILPGQNLDTQTKSVVSPTPSTVPIPTPGTPVTGAPNAISTQQGGNGITGDTYTATPSSVGSLRTSQGTYTGQDGNKYYTYDNSPINSGDSTSSIPTTSTGNENVDALAADQAQQAQDAKTFSDTIAGITNGTIPLSTGDQAQIDGLQQQFQQLIQQQGLINTGASGTANVRGYQSGAAEYDPSFQNKTINSVVTAGANKITNLQVQEASAVSALTESLKNNDIAGAKAAYDALNDAHTATQNSLKTVISDTQGAINDAHIQNVLASGITDPGDVLTELQKQGYTDITSADITSAIKNLSPDATDIYNVATTAVSDGANPDTVKLIMAAPDKQTALNILSQSGVANSAVTTMMTKYPDAGIVPGDTVEQANTKVQASPSYTMAQKSAALDLVAKQANIDKTFADIANESVSPDDTSSFLDGLSDFNGQKYITSTDLQGLTTSQKSAFEKAATEAGIPNLSTKDSDALDSIQAAQSDIKSFSDFITNNGSAILPKNFLGQPEQLANVTLNKYLQLNPQLGSYQTWTASVIPVLSALKGAGSGSGGSSRLFGTITSLLPAETDTLAVAQQKMNTINTLLTNGANSIIPPKNTSTYSGVTLPGGNTSSTGSASTFSGITLPN